ncbi:MAG: hypothetical protein M0R73_03115 [Dehalococcoidia bacterium]|nr:hypothetical protein [Dehalococcoidia bacterium]
MPKPDQVQDADLRAQIEKAYSAMRSGNGTEAVRVLADAYLYLLNKHPDMLDETIEPRPGRQMPAVMRWPALGANLTLESVMQKKPRIEFMRDRFAVSEAITYYEYTLESAIQKGA